MVAVAVVAAGATDVKKERITSEQSHWNAFISIVFKNKVTYNIDNKELNVNTTTTNKNTIQNIVIANKLN